jgi:hypothetical protein
MESGRPFLALREDYLCCNNLVVEKVLIYQCHSPKYIIFIVQYACILYVGLEHMYTL